MGLKLFSSELNDDSNDRLNNFFTPLLLLACAVVTCKRQYIGSPLSCWAPKHFTPAHVEYAESACWVRNTYFVADGRRIPAAGAGRQAEELSYYQWVSFLLVAQALLFQAPGAVWQELAAAAAAPLRKILGLCAFADRPRLRRRVLNEVVAHVEELLDSGGSGWGLAGAYLVAKLLYIANVLGQFALVAAFLSDGGGRSGDYGLGLAVNLTLGRDWRQSGRFPRVTFCDFDVRVLGNVQRHTVQCVLQVNRLNEKVFALLWFWFSGVGCLTLASCVGWCRRLLLPRRRRWYATQLLRAAACLPTDRCQQPPVARQLDSFVGNRLRPDGLLVLSLIDANGGEAAAASVCSRLWLRFCHAAAADQHSTSTSGASESSGLQV